MSLLTQQEIDALLAAVDRSSWVGRRDHTLLTVTVQAGLRVSELTGLRIVSLPEGEFEMLIAKTFRDRKNSPARSAYRSS